MNKNNAILEKNNEIIETIGKDYSNEISAHSKILQNSNNIFIKFKKSKIRIKLLNSNTLQKISSLLNKKTLEKNVKFKSDLELSDTDSDNDSKNCLKGIAKLKERLNKSDNNNNFEHILIYLIDINATKNTQYIISTKINIPQEKKKKLLCCY